MKIIVNGKEKYVVNTQIFVTYRQLITMAGFKSDEIISVTYKGKTVGDTHRSGILSPDKSVEIEEGMIFNAHNTGNA